MFFLVVQIVAAAVAVAVAVVGRVLTSARWFGWKAHLLFHSHLS